MANYSGEFPDAGTLQRIGPLLQVAIFPAHATPDELTRGRDANFVDTMLSFNTASDTTMISETKLTRLGLEPVSEAVAKTTSGVSLRSRMYQCDLVLIGDVPTRIAGIQIAGVDMSGFHFDGYLGMDVISRGVFILNSPKGFWEFSIA